MEINLLIFLLRYFNSKLPTRDFAMYLGTETVVLIMVILGTEKMIVLLICRAGDILIL